ncbi:MAG TPA: hypothetical protein VNT75_14050 [Symbiobacteriaceae bacterium]|nr:hypothetical protein [Symbiobacteriaceae bacterium]
MNIVDLFLREHGAGHSSAVVQHPLNSDSLWKGMGEAGLRTRPHGLNSLAWLFWHMTRVEDANVACAVAGTAQVLDDQWASRLRVTRRDVGTGMTKAEVAELSEQIDLQALWDYREAVGRRTRALVSSLGSDYLLAPFTEDDLRRAAAEGVLDGDEHWLVGIPREALLFWWGAHHTLMHVGQVMMVKNALRA